jgi:TetR/AcrR family transcriptional regulator, transcriptional repressor for nem operon
LHETKKRLLEAGLMMLLERGYHGLGVQDLLDRTGIPRGSFYHHFESKESLALQAVDMYAELAHAQLEASLSTAGRPLERIRDFFEHIRQMYASEGYLGCFLGALGQELSGMNDVFRRKIEACFASLAAGLAECVEEARQGGELPHDTDPQQFATVLIQAWEGAALRSRLVRSDVPLECFFDFYFSGSAVR